MNSSPEPLKNLQAMRSLEKANRVRRERAELRRSLKHAANRREALIMLAEMIERQDSRVQTALLGWMIESCRGCGRTYSRRFLHMIGASQWLRIENLSDRRREEVVTLLREGI